MTEQMKLPKMNKRGQFLARDWVISLIIFTGFISLTVLFVTGLATEYDNTDIVDESIVENYGFLDNTTSIASQAFDATNEREGLSFLGSFDILFSSAFTVISLVFGSISLAGSAMAQFAIDFGIPSQVANVLFPMFLSIITVILVFVIISTTTRRDF